MGNTSLVRRSLKLDKFKSLIAFTTSTLILNAPFMVTGLGLTNFDLATTTDFVSMMGGFFLGTFSVLGAATILLSKNESKSLFIQLFTGELLKGAWNNMELKEFQSNNEKAIIKLRKMSNLSDLSEEHKIALYKKCAQLEFEKLYCTDVYSKWFSQLESAHSSIDWTKRLNLNGQTSKYKWEILYDLSVQIRKQAGWDEVAFKKELVSIIENQYAHRFTGFRNAGIYKYMEQKNEKLEGIEKQPTTSNYIQKTYNILAQDNYRLSQSDYNELAKGLRKFDKHGIKIVQELKEQLPYPKASWALIKNIILDNYTGHNGEVDSFLASLDEAIKLEWSEDEQSKLLKIAIDTVRKNEGHIAALEFETSKQKADKATKQNKEEDTSALLQRCQLVDYEASYHKEIWAELKKDYNVIYDNSVLLEPMEFKKLNMAMQRILPLMIKSDQNFKNIGSKKAETLELLASNLNMVLSDVKEVYKSIEQKVHLEATVNNRYLHIRAGK